MRPLVRSKWNVTRGREKRRFISNEMNPLRTA